MSTAKAPPPPKAKKERERDKDKERERDKKERLSQPPTTERLKTIVRRLPPNLPEDVFWQSVQAWVSDETVTWKIFYPGKLRKRLNKENIPSRAYIVFKTEEQLAQFSHEYDGHLFRDKAGGCLAGNESYAVVEFAPYQKVPPEKKADARSGTIEKDEDFISFLESLNAQSSGAEPPTLESLIAANQPPPPPKTTPLLEALKAEKAAQREKETAIRQIAQAKRDEAKKKNAPPPQVASSSSAPLSKKAAKKAAAAAAAAQQQGQAQKPGSAANNAPPRPPKAAKPPRPQPRVPGPPAVPTVVAVASAANPSTGAAPVPSTSANDPPRRTRPVIGLASRQFEAALSGAGVAGAGGAERKSRRERERERAAAAAAAGAPPDDKKDKQPRRKDSISGGVALSTAGASGSSEVRVPSILQRAEPVVAPPVVIHRIDGDVHVPAQAGVIPVNFTNGAPSVGRGGGGPRRGRGGRGRGGVVGGGVAVSRGG
ncbi:Smg-4/UPF3 family-domain-containing protein [Mycena rebaudengoi]|nr:Smg-4/UPF3 family-domain-containing protein [Mycena rebaudengoi]